MQYLGFDLWTIHTRKINLWISNVSPIKKFSEKKKKVFVKTESANF